MVQNAVSTVSLNILVSFLLTTTQWGGYYYYACHRWEKEVRQGQVAHKWRSHNWSVAVPGLEHGSDRYQSPYSTTPLKRSPLKFQLPTQVCLTPKQTDFSLPCFLAINTSFRKLLIQVVLTVQLIPPKLSFNNPFDNTGICQTRFYTVSCWLSELVNVLNLSEPPTNSFEM